MADKVRQWGGRREGSGAKPLTPEQRIERAMSAQSQSSELMRVAVGELLKVTGMSPRRRLLLGERVRVRSDGAWAAAFLEATCVQTIGRFAGKPLVLEKWQRDFFEDALAFDDEGRYLYGSVLLGIPRKNGKTTSVAGVAVVKLSPAEGEGKPIIPLAAGSKEQAGPLWDQVVDFVNGSRLLRALMVASKSEISSFANGGELFRVAGDGKLNHGLNPYFIPCDELHSWMTPRQRENFNALTTSDGAREDSQLFAISTAGFDLRTVMGELYTQAKASPAYRRMPSMGDGGFIVRDREARLLVHWYGISAKTRIDDIKAWKRANPASWRTPERIAEDLRKLTVDEPTKRRLYGNQWTSAKDVWIPADLWEALGETGKRATFERGVTVALGVDASLNHDTTAVGMASWLPDGRIKVRSRVFSTRRDAPAHRYFEGSRIELGEVEAEIAGDPIGSGGYLDEFDVNGLGFDPRYFNRSAEDLEKAGVVTIEYSPGGISMWSAVQDFYNLCLDQMIVHDFDPVLEAHVAAAAGEKTERGWRVSKLKASSPIDGLISVILAVDVLRKPPDEDDHEPFVQSW